MLKEAKANPAAIDEFKGDYRWLSNFWPCEVRIDDEIDRPDDPESDAKCVKVPVYSCVESAYQAAKSLDPTVREAIRSLSAAGDMKKLGSRIDVRPDWDDCKLRVMESLLLQKFAPGSDLAKKLMKTGTTPLVEGNTWGDTFWGVCKGEGSNHLGRLLESIRLSLRTGKAARVIWSEIGSKVEEGKPTEDTALVVWNGNFKLTDFAFNLVGKRLHDGPFLGERIGAWENMRVITFKHNPERVAGKQQVVKMAAGRFPHPSPLNDKCNHCKLYKTSPSPFLQPSKFGTNPRVAIIIESGTLSDTCDVAASTKKLCDWLQRERRDVWDCGVWIIPAIRCVPAKFSEAIDKWRVAEPSKSNINACGPFTAHTLRHLGVDVIVPMGKIPCSVTINRADMMNVVGRTYELAGSRIPVFPMWAHGFAVGETRKDKYVGHWDNVAMNLYDKPAPTPAPTPTLDKPAPVSTSPVTVVSEPVPVPWVEGDRPDTILKWLEPVLAFKGADEDNVLWWDVETNGISPFMKGFVCGLLSMHHKAAEKPILVPLDYFDQKLIDPSQSRDICRRVIESPRIRKGGHNLKFDERAVRSGWGWKAKGFYKDTMVDEYCLDPNTQSFRGLDDLVRKYAFKQFGEYWRDLDQYRAEREMGYDYCAIPKRVLYPYTALDTEVLPVVSKCIVSAMENAITGGRGQQFVYMTDEGENMFPTFNIKEYARRVRSCHHRITAEMECNGVKVDLEVAEHLYAYYDELANKMSKDLAENKFVQEFESKLLATKMSKSAYEKWAKEKFYTELEPDSKPRRKLADVKAAVNKAKLQPRINWGSQLEVKNFFIDFLEFPVIKLTESGNPSIDEETLRTWVSMPYEGDDENGAENWFNKKEAADKLLEFREHDKFLTSYIGPVVGKRKASAKGRPPDPVLFADGKLHPNLNITGPKTSRLAANRPNVQAMPRDGYVKRIYIPSWEKGWMLQRDYSGLEVRFLAAVSGDARLVNAFLTGQDPHFYTQQHFFGDAADAKNKTQRSVCKQSLFGRLYGQGDKGLYDLLRKNGVKDANGQPYTLEKCKQFNEMIDSIYPGVKRWVEEAHQFAIRNKCSTNMFGFTCPLYAMDEWEVYASKNKAGISSSRLDEMGNTIHAALRHSQNYPIQGGASDLTVLAAFRVSEELKRQGMKSRAVLTVHDSIYVESPPDLGEAIAAAVIMREVMDNSPKWLGDLLPGYDTSWMRVPIIGEAEIGVNAKDAFAAVHEPQTFEDDMLLSLPVPDDTEENQSEIDSLAKLFGKEAVSEKQVGFRDHHEAIQEFLHHKRFFMPAA